jgi:hypothetical protein
MFRPASSGAEAAASGASTPCLCVGVRRSGWVESGLEFECTVWAGSVQCISMLCVVVVCKQQDGAVLAASACVLSLRHLTFSKHCVMCNSMKVSHVYIHAHEHCAKYP